MFLASLVLNLSTAGSDSWRPDSGHCQFPSSFLLNSYSLRMQFGLPWSCGSVSFIGLEHDLFCFFKAGGMDWQNSLDSEIFLGIDFLFFLLIIVFS